MSTIYPMNTQGFHSRGDERYGDVDPRSIPVLDDIFQSIRRVANKLTPEARDALLYPRNDDAAEIRVANVEQGLQLHDQRQNPRPDINYLQAGQNIDLMQYEVNNKDEWIGPA